MNKNWTVCIITSIICRLLGLVAVLAFVFAMVVFTGSLHCLWLLFLLLAVDIVPTYEFKREFPIEKENKK
jgi:putative effector of murein hydrolase LrgA (UPF0299 family)